MPGRLSALVHPRPDPVRRRHAAGLAPGQEVPLLGRGRPVRGLRADRVAGPGGTVLFRTGCLFPAVIRGFPAGLCPGQVAGVSAEPRRHRADRMHLPGESVGLSVHQVSVRPVRDDIRGQSGRRLVGYRSGAHQRILVLVQFLCLRLPCYPDPARFRPLYHPAPASLHKRSRQMPGAFRQGWAGRGDVPPALCRDEKMDAQNLGRPDRESFLIRHLRLSAEEPLPERFLLPVLRVVAGPLGADDLVDCAPVWQAADVSVVYIYVGNDLGAGLTGK